MGAFAGLWAVQAALVAVVYPIVVAFITVLLQRSNASKASLHAYFSRSAAKLTGLSSLFLVLLMAIQFVVLERAEPLVAFAWLIGDSAWAVVNIALCLVFLHATFEFASPEGRAEARFEYVLTQAWPTEWEHHIKRLISFDPVKHDLVNGEWAVKDLAGTGPAFSNPGDGLAKEHSTHFRFRREKSVDNIFYLLVQIAFDLWSRSAGERQPEATDLNGWKRAGPVFQLSVAHGDRFSFDQPVAVTSGSMPLTRVQHWLLWGAISLTRRRVAPRVLVRDALEELRTDAASAIQADAEAEFGRQLQGLIQLLDAIVEASAYSKHGSLYNWTLLNDSEYFGSPHELIRTWLRSLRDLHGVALKAIGLRDVFASRTVHTGSRLITRQSKSLNDELRRIYVQHQYLLLYDLLGWGAEGCAAATSGVDERPGKVLDEPMRRRYDRVLREGLSAWESLKNYRVLLQEADQDSTWEASSSGANILSLHLQFNAQLVTHAMRADDRAGFEYFTDSLMKWVGQGSWRQADSGLEYGDRYRVTVSDLGLPLDEFRARFPIPAHETEGPISIKAVRAVALKNLWRDVALTLVASSLEQANAGLISKGLAARLVKHLIDGVPILDEGDFGSNPRPFDNADRVLSSLFRQLVEGNRPQTQYREFIDKLVESVGFNLMDSGISGRMYSFGGSELDKILDAQLIILARFAPRGWNPSQQIERTMRGWAAESVLRRQMLDQLRSWALRLAQGDLATRYGWLWDLAPLAGGLTLDEHFAQAKAGLDRLLDRLSKLREEEVRAAEIADSAKARVARAAAVAIRPPAEWFPAQFLKQPIEVAATVLGAKSASFTLSGYSKGAMTDPVMDPLEVNEADYIGNLTANALAFGMLKDVSYREDTDQREASDMEVWCEELRLWASRCQELSLRPLAVVPNRMDPPWLIDLVRKRAGEIDQAARVRKRTEFSNQRGYVGHLGEVALFTGPVSTGMTALLTIEEFESLQLESEGDQTFRVDATADETGLKCTLKISWRQLLSGKKGPVRRLSHLAAKDQ